MPFTDARPRARRVGIGRTRLKFDFSRQQGPHVERYMLKMRAEALRFLSDCELRSHSTWGRVYFQDNVGTLTEKAQ